MFTSFFPVSFQSKLDAEHSKELSKAKYVDQSTYIKEYIKNFFFPCDHLISPLCGLKRLYYSFSQCIMSHQYYHTHQVVSSCQSSLLVARKNKVVK